MLPVLILLVSQINPYGEAQAQIIVPSAAGKFATGLGGAGVVGALEQNGTLAVEAVPGAGVNLDYLRTRGGLDEDYRLAQILIARTLQRRLEAARLQAAANDIELNNARLRAYLCARFCAPGINTLPATPMFPSQYPGAVDPAYGVDPLLAPTADQLPADTTVPLPFVPPRDFYNGRFYIRHGGAVQVQVLPQPAVYRGRY